MKFVRARKALNRRIGGPNNKCAGAGNKGKPGGDHAETEMRMHNNHIKPHKRSIDKRKYGVCEGVTKRKKSPLGENERARLKLNLTAKPNNKDPLGVRNGRRVRSDSRVTRRVHSAPPKARSDRHKPKKPKKSTQEAPSPADDPPPVQSTPPSTSRTASSKRGNTTSFIRDSSSSSVVRTPRSSAVKSTRANSKSQGSERARSRRSSSNSRSNGGRFDGGDAKTVLFETSAEKRARTGKSAVAMSVTPRSQSASVTRSDGAGPSNTRSPKKRVTVDKFSPYRPNKRGLPARNWFKFANNRSPNQMTGFYSKKRIKQPKTSNTGPGQSGTARGQAIRDNIPKVMTNLPGVALSTWGVTWAERNKLHKEYVKKQNAREARNRLKSKLKYPKQGSRKSSRKK